jgi:hypothetical protein
MKEREQKIVLDPSVTADKFEEVAERLGWTFAEERPATDLAAYELIYRNGGTEIHYAEDLIVMVRYVLARGSDISGTVKEIRDNLPTESDEAILAAAEADTDDLQDMIDWLLSATVLGDQVGHDRLVRLVEKRLSHPNSGVRRAAIIAVSWLEWPDFRSLVEKLAKEDSAEDVRADAARLAEAYRLRDEGKL